MRGFESRSFSTESRQRQRGSTRVWMILGVGVVGVLVLALLRSPSRPTGAGDGAAGGASGAGGGNGGGGGVGSGTGDERARPRLASQGGGGGGQRNPEAVVAEKVAQFTQGRRRLAESMAQKFGVQVPAEVDQFFTAVEGGDWRTIKSLFNQLETQREVNKESRDLEVLWPMLKETFGVAQIAKVWRPDDLLDYGQAILGSLKPGAVYLGSSDAGRFIPTLLNETSGEGRHVILSQGSLGEAGYLDYANFAYGDRLSTLSRDDAQKGFQAFMESTVQPSNGGETAAGGGDAARPNRSSAEVMAGFKDRLLLSMVEKNPGLTFVVESASASSELAGAVTPVGAVLELRAPGAQSGVTAESAAQTVEFWRSTVDRLQSLPEGDETAAPRDAFAQMAVSQANILAAQSHPAEAEQAYRLAAQIAPTSYEPISALVNYLQVSGRTADAMQAIDEFVRVNPAHVNMAEDLRRRLQSSESVRQSN